MIPLERAVSLTEAEQRIDQSLTALGLTCTLVRHGAPMSSTVATLHGADEQPGEREGCGKGHPDEARVGAKFEAYEHFHAVRALRDATLMTCFADVIAQQTLVDVLPARMLSAQRASLIGVIRFDAPGNDAAPLHYPTFLIDHTYASSPLPGDDVDYHAVRRYACGTGLAAGVGATEALVHALGEVIERHAVGTWIAQTYYRKRPGCERTIDPATLPATLAHLLEQASNELEAPIVLSHARSDIDCPVVIARCRDRQIAGLHVAGSGASLYPAHAAARAIKELVQQYKVAEGERQAMQHWNACVRRFQRWPRLQPCLILPPGGADQEQVAFSALGGEQQPLDLDAHLRALRQRCRSAQRPVWTRVLREDAGGVALACACMPRMERFAIAALGGVVVPTYA